MGRGLITPPSTPSRPRSCPPRSQPSSRPPPLAPPPLALLSPFSRPSLALKGLVPPKKPFHIRFALNASMKVLPNLKDRVPPNRMLPSRPLLPPMVPQGAVFNPFVGRAFTTAP